MSSPSYLRIESGDTKLNNRHVAILRLVFKVNPRWLSHGEDPMILTSSTREAEMIDTLKRENESLKKELSRYKKMVDILTD